MPLTPEYPRITYQTEGRTFDRLFKEHSLHATKVVVRKKLGLGHDAPIELAQLRDGKKIDLEDDDDFEAFRALANSSLHATVAVTIPPSGSSAGVNALGEKRRRPNEPTPETYPQGGAESNGPGSIPGSPVVQSPSMHVTGTRRPRKRRKVAFNCDPVTSETTHSVQPPSLSGNDIGPSSPNPAPAFSVLVPQPSSETTERTKFSTQVQVPTTNSGKHKSNTARVIHQDDEAIVPPETSRKKGKKKDVPLKGREPLPDHGMSGRRDISPSPETQVKRVRKKAKKAASEPATEIDAVPTEMLVDRQRKQPQEATSVTADVSLHGVVNSDMHKQAKTGGQEPRLVKAKGGAKSKSGLVDPAEDGMLDSAKSLKRKASKKKVQPEVSTAGDKDDIDKTITALLNRRMHPDPRTFSDPATEIELTVASGSNILSTDPPLTGMRKRGRLKTGPSPEENQRSSKLRRPLASQEVAEQEMATAGLHPTSDHHTIFAQPSESGPVRRKSPVHTLADRTAVKGASSITAHIAQTEVNANSRHVASEETTVTLPALTGNAQSVPSRLTGRFSIGNASQAAFGEGSRTGSKPTIPEGLAISGVPVQAHGEGSSDESSSEDEDEEGTVPLAKPATSIADPSIPMNLLEDQLTALIRGPEKRGPRRSVLDEIPSSSETGSESSSEDLMLDEEEDLSRQPSRKQRTLSKSRLSSMEPEPEPTSEDEGSASLHVFMDTPNEMQHCIPVSILYSLEGSRKEIDNLSSKRSTTGEVEVASADADANAERGTSEHGTDTPTERPLKGRGQDISGSVQIPPGKSHTSGTRPGTNTPGTTSSGSDATAIDTAPAKSSMLASIEQLSGRVLVPASSPFVTMALVNAGEKVQSQDEIDDVEPADESIDGDKESDPIEFEPNEPSVDLPAPRPSANTIPRQPRRLASRATLNPSPDSEQPSRRSGRLANRRSSLATPVLARQPDRKVSLSLKKSAAKEDHERTHDEIAQEKPARNQVGKGRKFADQTTQRSTNPDDTLAQEHGPTRVPSSQVEWTTLLPPTSKTQVDVSSPIDELRTSSPGPVRQLLPVGDDDVSRSADIGENTPMPIRRGVTATSQGKRGGGQPLFFPGSSQAPRTQTAPSPSASESEPENVAPALPRKTPTRSTPGGGLFRSLSELASQDILFPKSRAAKRAFNNTPSRKVKGPFPEGDDDEDDEESSSSGDDTGEVPKSHIPKERRAGVTPRRKGRRLSSLAKLGRAQLNDA
ncbi:hypothetical protein BJY52DRAFT_1252889 [Lactarius psammicola]|nr:hypothetical protein BJY52DRAFT_1252889 [Lactarius psammicola]